MNTWKYKNFDYPIVRHDDGRVTYRGREIFPFVSQDGLTPKHIIKSYYVSEMQIIDRAIELEAWEEGHKEDLAQRPTVDEVLDEFLAFVNEN